MKLQVCVRNCKSAVFGAKYSAVRCWNSSTVAKPSKLLLSYLPAERRLILRTRSLPTVVAADRLSSASVGGDSTQCSWSLSVRNASYRQYRPIHSSLSLRMPTACGRILSTGGRMTQHSCHFVRAFSTFGDDPSGSDEGYGSSSSSSDGSDGNSGKDRINQSRRRYRLSRSGAGSAARRL